MMSTRCGRPTSTANRTTPELGLGDAGRENAVAWGGTGGSSGTSTTPVEPASSVNTWLLRPDVVTPPNRIVRAPAWVADASLRALGATPAAGATSQMGEAENPAAVSMEASAPWSTPPLGPPNTTSRSLAGS